MATQEFKDEIQQIGDKYFRAKAQGNTNETLRYRNQLWEKLFGDLHTFAEIKAEISYKKNPILPVEDIVWCYENTLTEIISKYFPKKDYVDGIYELYRSTLSKRVKDAILKASTQTKQEYDYKRKHRKSDYNPDEKINIAEVPPLKVDSVITNEDGEELNILDTVADKNSRIDDAMNYQNSFCILINYVIFNSRKYAESTKINWTALFFTDNIANIYEYELPFSFFKSHETDIIQNINPDFYHTFMNGDCEKIDDLYKSTKIQPLSKITHDSNDVNNWKFPSPDKIFIAYVKTIKSSVSAAAVSQNRKKYKQLSDNILKDVPLE